MKTRFSLEAAGRSFAVISQMWFVRRGPLLFMIGMSGPPTQGVEEEFLRIFDSIEIADRPLFDGNAKTG